MRFVSVCNSDIRFKKQKNQDALLLLHARQDVDDDVVLAVICDGVGGLARGEWASAVVAKAFRQWFYERTEMLGQQSEPEQVVFNDWDQLIQMLHKNMKQVAEREGCRLGTTVEALLLMRGRYYICHVGDCRTYLVDQKIQQLTVDHTVVQQEIMAGRLTADQARRDVRQSLLWQCVGAGKKVVPDFLTGDIQKGQMFLLCCDGFRRRTTEEEMSRLGLRSGLRAKKMQGILDHITDLCKKRGEKDNISSILILERTPVVLFQRGIFRSMEAENLQRHVITKDILMEHSSTDL